MKTTSKTLIDNHWEELQEIFDVQPFKFTGKTKDQIERLGYRVSYDKGNHPKMYIELDKTYVITLCSTGEVYSGRQCLRRIRKVFEEYEKTRIN